MSNISNCNNSDYNKIYTVNDVGKKKGCCNGFLFDGMNFFTSGNRGGSLGDISYPRTQGGRWNTTITNTKLFPVISKEVTKDSPIPIIKKQSGDIFKSTTHNMSKKELISYLSRNRAYLHR